jgi:hypothetical protein
MDPSTNWPETIGDSFEVATREVAGVVQYPAMRIVRKIRRITVPNRDVTFLVNSFEISFLFPERELLNDAVVLYIPALETTDLGALPKLIGEPLFDKILAKFRGETSAIDLLESHVCSLYRTPIFAESACQAHNIYTSMRGLVDCLSIEHLDMSSWSSLVWYERYKMEGKGTATFCFISEKVIELTLEIEGFSTSYTIYRKFSPAVIRNRLLRRYQ